ncbi:UNVERIFIED_CONTAM: hypothetical protein PYX00_007563 [Menopon gallinae]|uniref:InaF motif containing 2 n=1 Tax=Menopon gallinae TaxID=328185 RepID=A0AAW2HJR4_9NEOP
MEAFTNQLISNRTEEKCNVREKKLPYSVCANFPSHKSPVNVEHLVLSRRKIFFFDMSDDEDQISNVNDEDLHQGKSIGNNNTRTKIIRLLTVIAYLISVSMAAIMLSLYYIFLWNPSLPSTSARLVDSPVYKEETDFNTSRNKDFPST